MNESGPRAYDELRGATLDRLSIDWRNGIALVSFLPARADAESHLLRATAVVRVEVARGASAARTVRAVRTFEGPPPRVEITVESGETIVIEAGAVAVDPSGG